MQSGYEVSLFERNGVIAGETSANSLRIIHGGFRYLQQAALKRIVDSVRDQTYCLTTYPDLVQPLRCLMPLSRGGMKSRLPVICAAAVYGRFLSALKSPLAPPRTLPAPDAAALFSWCPDFFPHGALEWHDAQLNSHQELCNRLVSRLTNEGLNLFLSAEAHVDVQRGETYVSGRGVEKKV